MEKKQERAEDIDISELLAAGRDLEEIANAKLEVESMRLVYGVREGLMRRLNEKEKYIVQFMHLEDERKKGGTK